MGPRPNKRFVDLKSTFNLQPHCKFLGLACSQMTAFPEKRPGMLWVDELERQREKCQQFCDFVRESLTWVVLAQTDPGLLLVAPCPPPKPKAVRVRYGQTGRKLVLPTSG